ncbi:MAG: EF-P lysine aminoacylase GenX [Gammaproteobacteria bacterium]|nr:EF-P lysine aminoacylase GenX [Gammaproteobacteria bacterium]
MSTKQLKHPKWQPWASQEVLVARAEMLANIRLFFKAREVLEVETPLLGATTNPDPNLRSLRAISDTATERSYFLQTSPEFAMKRLLAAGTGDIYQVCKVFRDDERGRWHHPEFTLLEWYRIGWSLDELIDETLALIYQLSDAEVQTEPKRYSYYDCFNDALGVNPHRASQQQLKQIIEEQLSGLPPTTDNVDTLLDWILAVHILPKMDTQMPIVIVDYPKSQAALAQTCQRQYADGEDEVAERFEVVWQGVELANGFFELGDAVEQRQRFDTQNKQRQQLGLPQLELDQSLLSALSSGQFPVCAGVALGLDRLLMLKLGCRHIDEVLSFAVDKMT